MLNKWGVCCFVFSWLVLLWQHNGGVQIVRLSLFGRRERNLRGANVSSVVFKRWTSVRGGDTTADSFYGRLCRAYCRLSRTFVVVICGSRKQSDQLFVVQCTFSCCCCGCCCTATCNFQSLANVHITPIQPTVCISNPYFQHHNETIVQNSD